MDVLDLDLDKLCAELFVIGEGRLHRIAYRRLQVMKEVAGHDADAQPSQALAQVGAVVGAGPSGGGQILRVVTGHRGEHQCAVLDRARHRPGGVHAPGQRDDPVVADAAVGRPDSNDTVDRRRQADRAAGVGAHRTVTAARRDCDTGAAARTRREMRGVPGVAHGAVMRIGRGAAPCELVHVGLADEDRARLAQPGGDGRVGIGHPIAEHLAARGRARAAHGDVVLQGDRNAVQRPEAVPGRDHDLGGFRDLQRLFLEDGDVCTQHGVGRTDPRQGCLH